MNRNLPNNRLILLLSVLVVQLTTRTQAADAAITVDARHQLFLDDHLISSMTNVQRAVEQAQKFSGNPVLWPTKKWEPEMATAYGSVIRDGDKFKMWYKSGMGVAYAESSDGEGILGDRALDEHVAARAIR